MRLCSALAALVASLTLAVPMAAQAPSDLYRQYVGRLRTSKGRCTAFPIHSRYFHNSVSHHDGGYRVLFLTAGHCVSDVMHYEQPEVTVYYGEIPLRHSRAIIPVRVLAVSHGVIGHDIAVLGAIMLYQLPTLEVDMAYEPIPGEPLLLAGFGRGAWLEKVGPFVGWDPDGRLVVHATSSPGNSGAPVIVPGTRKVIGVGTETTYPPEMLRSPITCMLAACPPQPPYYASSVRRLLGLIKWPPPAE